MADIETIRSETEKLVDIANERLLNSIRRSERRVLKAEWVGERYGYCLTLECAHTMEVPQPQLRYRVLCLDCVKEKLL